MSRAEIRQLAQFAATERYLAGQQIEAIAQSANPSVTATLGARDPLRGSTAVQTSNGGTASVSLLTTGNATPQASVLPAVTLGNGGNYADARP
jgi:hypothetical protein